MIDFAGIFRMMIRSVLFSIATSVVIAFIFGRVSAQSPPAPAAVTNLAAVAGDEQVTLSWTDPKNTSITTYQYRQSTDSGSNWSPDWTNITGSDKNTTSHTVTSLTNNTVYTFEIRAVNATGNGASGSVTATPTLPPLTVTWPEDIKGTEDSSIWTSLTSTPLQTPQISVYGGRPSYKYEIAKEGAPNGLSIDQSSGTLTGTPTESGDFTVRVVVRDKAGQSVSNDALNIMISPPLSVSPIACKTVEQDSMITPIHLSASGGWESYTYSISGAPMGISLSSDNRITGSPSQSGTSTITVTVTDDHGSTAERSFNMSVYSIDLAKKFSPILILTKNPTQSDRKVIFPEPVEIMGAESVSNLWFSLHTVTGQFLERFQYPASGWSSDLLDAYQNLYADINFSQNKFASLPEVLSYTGRPPGDYAIGAHPITAHFEYTGNGDRDDESKGKDSWYDYYNSTTHPKRGDHPDFPHTAYVHIFEEGGQVVIQYYYFYPFNDFQNDHEGDWPHVNVRVTSYDPEAADLVGIDYKFHGKGMNYTSIGERIFDPRIDFAPAEGETHPVIYVGVGSHGSFPTGGNYTSAAEFTVDEDLTRSGIILSTNVEDTNPDVAQSYDLILLPNPDPDQPNKGLAPEMSWLGTGALWGTAFVPSQGNNKAAAGPFHSGWGSWGASGYDKVNVPYTEFQQFPIVQDVRWSGTIKLIGDIVVYPGATLTIDAGTTIRAAPNRDIHDMKDANHVDIINYGTINANGASLQPIVFRSDTLIASAGDWYGIRNHGHLTMSHCTIQHAVVGLDLQGTQTLTDMTLSNNTDNTPLTITSIADVAATQNVAITDITVSASGGWAPYTYSTSDLPSGIVFDQNRVLITGRPKSVGDSDITVTVRDAVNDEASTTFTISVSAPTQALRIAAIANITATQNEDITPIQVNASGGRGNYAYSIASNPKVGAGLSISDSGLITGRPTQARDFTITVTVVDGKGLVIGAAPSPVVSRSFTMTVNAPTPVSSPLTVAEINDITVKISAVQTNSAITPIQVSASGGQTPYRYSLSNNPASGSGLSIHSSSGRITGTPIQARTFTLTVTVTDKAKKTATESFSMAVSLIGDFNGDGVVNLSDHSLFVAVFGLSEDDDGFNGEMDMNGDGTINTADFLIFVSHFPNASQFF